tara:strand:+ start:958 stop:1200 length:243 start_codon:yes stop_codon:yes gene_type:complete
MVNQVYKFKATITNIDQDSQFVKETKYFFNTKQITQNLGIPRSSIFMMLHPEKRNIEKYRHIKLERCSEPAFVKVQRIIL